MQTVEQISGPDPSGAEPLCLFLVHNEMNILPQFFAHYRSLGPMRFLAIDDRSSDGSRDFLAAQPDVSLFSPTEGTAYKTHKKQWRSEPLDRFAAGRWCVIPDVDEHLVWRDFETRSLAQLIGDLERDGVEGIAATMVDMYADKPIGEHISSGAPLIEDFPYFDDPLKDPAAYRAMLPGRGFRRKFPTPLMCAMGGMRDRIAGRGIKVHPALGRWMLNGSIQRHFMPDGTAYAREALAYLLGRARGKPRPLDLSKLPLLRWRLGGSFNGGAHHLSHRLRLAREKAVLLHFALTKGAGGIDYTVNRAQHAEGSGYYGVLKPLVDVNPMYHGSTKYVGSECLAGFY